jgi:DNA-binding NarL/FixJ family response regulator
MVVTVPPIRLLLADDSDVMRRAIGNLLFSKANGIAVQEASNCPELLHALGENKPDVVLLDVQMLKSLEERDDAAVKSLLRHSKVLAMSIWTDEETTEIAVGCGAVKLLDKASLAVSLIPAIEECARSRN